MIEMIRCCENCKHCFIDYSVDYYECQVADAMEEEEFDCSWDSNGKDCKWFMERIEPDYTLLTN